MISGITNFRNLIPGNTISFMNGETQGTVQSVDDDTLRLSITSGAFLRPNCHVHFSQSDHSASTDNALEDRLIALACQLEWDYIAVSMIHSIADLDYYIQQVDANRPTRRPKIVAKFETAASILEIDTIIKASDAIFVARGDLGQCLPLSQLPAIQKQIISRSVEFGKKVFVATQMLSSMTQNTTPTRAEVTDMANAVWDGADALTLSEETAIGDHPDDAISMMADVIRAATNHPELYRPQISIQTPMDWPFPLNPAIMKLLEQIADISRRIWEKGWAEANAGNLSMDISDLLPKAGESSCRWYLVSRGGSRYRQMAENPINNLVLIKTEAGQITQYPKDARPTSEWSCHLGLHHSFGDASRRFILHAHPSSIIAVSQSPMYRDPDIFNQILADVLPEMPLYLPRGIACGLHLTPGSEELARNSVAVIGERKVLIWQKHGILCCGYEPDEAFDYLEIVAKAAQVWLDLQIISLNTHFS